MSHEEVRPGEVLLMSTTAWTGDHYYVAGANSLVPRIVQTRDGDWQHLSDTYGARGLAQRYREPALCAITAGVRNPGQLVLRWTGSPDEVVIDEALRISAEDRAPRRGRVRYRLESGTSGSSDTGACLDLVFRSRIAFAFDRHLLAALEADEDENVIALALRLARRPDERAHHLRWMQG